MKGYMGKSRTKHLHICTYTLFNEPFIDFINKNFDSEEHLFLILTNTEKIPSVKNVRRVSKKISDLFSLVKESYKCEKIFLHGLIHREIVSMFFFQPWLLKKCHWILFGEDLYCYEEKKGLPLKLFESVRRFVIKNIGGIIAGYRGDYELARKWYGAKGKFYHSFLYPNFIHKKIIRPEVNQEKKVLRIQIGHSADPRNKHLEVFGLLEKYKDNIEITCPLVYGYDDYREEVMRRGVEIFGQKFKPMTELVSVDEYSRFLSSIDVAIFPHKGNLAGGNMIILIGLGKKVYARSDTTSWAFYKELGLKLYDIEKEMGGILDDLPSDIQSRNKEIIRNHFTEEKLIKDWETIFQN